MAEQAQNKFTFELVSPEQKLIDTPAWQVIVPGEEGDLGVRAGHMALIVSIRPGIVQIFRESDSVPVKIFIAGGFADVSQDHCTILAEEAYDVANLNAEKLAKDIENLTEELKFAETSEEKSRITARKELLSSMLQAIAH